VRLRCDKLDRTLIKVCRLSAMSSVPLIPRLALDAAGFVTADGRPLNLPPKERAVLALLLQRQPHVVGKDEFADEAWRGGLMSDESLARSISRLRRTLRPLGLLIESVYGSGYRLSATEVRLPQATSLEAYQHAQHLAQQRTPAGLGRAIALLRGLVEQEPGFAPARVALAEALAAAIGWGLLPTQASIHEGLLILDPLWPPSAAVVPGLHGARGALLDMAWRFEEARQCHEQSMHGGTTNASSLLAYSRHLLFTNRAADAVQQLRAALQLSPHTAQLRITLSRALLQAGRGAEALAEARAAVVEHPGQLLLVAFELALRALVAPVEALEPAARRLGEGIDPPPFAWTVLSFVLARLGRHEAALDVIDAALICSKTSTGEASLYAAPLAALGQFERAARLLHRAYEERSGMLAMVLRDPANADWLERHPEGKRLVRNVFGTGMPAPKLPPAIA
jgi:DNA-binding winged helix-turn-helix (wHTH) protein